MSVYRVTINLSGVQTKFRDKYALIARLSNETAGFLQTLNEEPSWHVNLIRPATVPTPVKDLYFVGVCQHDNIALVEIWAQAIISVSGRLAQAEAIQVVIERDGVGVERSYDVTPPRGELVGPDGSEWMEKPYWLIPPILPD